MTFAGALRGVSLAAITVLVILLVLVLGVRFVLVPNLHWWEPYIEGRLSESLKQTVSIDGLRGEFNGFDPKFWVTAVQIGEDGAKPKLLIRNLQISFELMSVHKRQALPASLNIEAASVEIERDAAGAIHVAGLPFRSQTQEPQDERPDWLTWLDQSHQYLIDDLTVVYRDVASDKQPFSMQARVLSEISGGEHVMKLQTSQIAGQRGQVTLDASRRLSRTTGLTLNSSIRLSSLELSTILSLLPGGMAGGAGLLNLDSNFRVEDGSLSSIEVNTSASDVEVPTESSVAKLAEAQFKIIGKRIANDNLRIDLLNTRIVSAEGRTIELSDQSVFAVFDQNNALKAGQLGLKHLNLANLLPFVQSFPLPGTLGEKLANVRVAGAIDELSFKFDRSASPVETDLAFRFTNLTVIPDLHRFQEPPREWGPTAPAVENLSGTVHANADRGTAKLYGANVANLAKNPQDHHGAGGEKTAVILTGIFAQPRIELNKFAADLSWEILTNEKAGQTTPGFKVQLHRVELANKDAYGEVSGSYQKSPGSKGVADLSGWLKGANAARVPVYLPSKLPLKLRRWLRTAKPVGRSNDIQWRLKGDLEKFPFRESGSGEFGIEASVTKGQFSYSPQWPRVTNITTKLKFHNQGLRIDIAEAALIEDLLTSATTVKIEDYKKQDLTILGKASGPLAKAKEFLIQTPLRDRVPSLLKQSELLGSAEVELELEIPLRNIPGLQYDGRLSIADGGIELDQSLPGARQMIGDVYFSNAGVRSERLSGIVMDNRFTVSFVADAGQPVAAKVSGQASARMLERLAGQSDTGLLKGKTSFGLKLVQSPSDEQLRVELASDLVGLEINLPTPFGKPADSEVPLAIRYGSTKPQSTVAGSDTARMLPAADELAVDLGTIASAKFERELNAKGGSLLKRVALGIGSPAKLPAAGTSIAINLDRIDVDAWAKVVEPFLTQSSAHVNAVESRNAAGVLSPAALSPIALNATIARVRLFQREFNDLVVDADWIKDKLMVAINSDLIAGEASLSEGKAGEAGRYVARFSRFEWPERDGPSVARLDYTEAKVVTPKLLPAIDLEIDRFALGKAYLGQLKLSAKNVADRWIIESLNLIHPAAELGATGSWTKIGQKPGGKTDLTFSLNILDSGIVLSDLGMPDLIRDGPGKLTGGVSWNGPPTSFDIPSLSGSLTVAFKQGQFLKADPGLAKLIGVVSMQAVSRRIRLDFGDVFDEGFTFDAAAGEATIERGTVRIDPFLMHSVQADVLLSGSVDLVAQSQNLNAKLEPHINAGLASIAYAAFVNPAAGLGALLAQWLLKDPLSSVFGYEYAIMGSWTDPTVKEIRSPSLEADPAYGF